MKIKNNLTIKQEIDKSLSNFSLACNNFIKSDSYKNLIHSFKKLSAIKIRD